MKKTAKAAAEADFRIMEYPPEITESMREENPDFPGTLVRVYADTRAALLWLRSEPGAPVRRVGTEGFLTSSTIREQIAEAGLTIRDIGWEEGPGRNRPQAARSRRR